ncbi:MAG: hypothetical protein WBM40_11480 [Thiohalocapsa sp.]
MPAESAAAMESLAPAPVAPVPATPVPTSNGEATHIAEAVIHAYSLETEYWRDPERFSDWNALYDYYRLGFSASIAEDMTDFTLSNGGDMATWRPSEVHVVNSDSDFALAWFRTPDDVIQSAWGFQPYMVVRLRRESGAGGERWVIYWATDSARPPKP